MFKFSDIFSSFSVDDLEKAKDFYNRLLGIPVSDVPDMKGIFKLNINNNNSIIVYSKPNHVPATFTILNIPVENVEKTVDELISTGIKCEVYNDGNIKTDKKGIYRGEGPKIAWFKDPAGNIISVLEEHNT